MAERRYTAKQVAEAIRQARGLKAVAARRLGCVRNTVQNYIDRYSTCRQAVIDAREDVVDLAEGRLYQAVDGGEAWAVGMVLKTLGRERGYGERIDVNVICRREAERLAAEYDIPVEQALAEINERARRALA